MEESNKFKYLKIAKDKGINVPNLIHLDFENYDENKINLFLKNSPSKLFIIRSAILNEDSNTISYAGHFYSSSKLLKKQVIDEIWSVKSENEKLIIKYQIKSKVNLFIQEYIDSNQGGVTFFPWKYYLKHALVNFSTTGIQDCVNGINSKSYLISLDPAFEVSSLEKKFDLNIKKKLINLIKKLKKIFSFKFDIEWVYYNKKIYLLQLRPVTIEPSSLFGENKKIQRINLDKISKNSTHLEYTQLSENLGVLSPLSFSLINTLFNESNYYLKQIHFQANNKNYLFRLSNGQVLVNTTLYSLNYKNTSFLSSFIRGFKSIKHLQLINKFIEEYLKQNSEKFNYNSLKSIFGYWQQSIIYSYHLKRKVSSNYFSYNEYELTNIFTLPTPKYKFQKDWNSLNKFLKVLFLFELNKLKLELKQLNKQFQFTDFSTYLKLDSNSEISSLKLTENYLNDLNYGVFDVSSLLVQFSTKKSSISNKDLSNLNGEVVIIKNPNLELLPSSESQYSKKILICKFFKNEWISQINNFKGILIELGGELSHSAIVAREKNILYVINQKDITSKFKNGDVIYYNSKTNSFEKKVT